MPKQKSRSCEVASRSKTDRRNGSIAMMVLSPRSETKTVSGEGGRRVQIPERGGLAVGLFQSLFGAASAACSQSRSKSHSVGSTVKVSRLGRNRDEG